MSRSRGRARRRSATPAPDRRPAPAARSRQRRPRAVHSVAPPAVALVISSPAIVAGLTGTTEPLNAFAIVVVALTASWVLSAVGVKVADTVPARIGAPPARSLDTGPTTGAVALGRIEPVRVPADQAIPGTPPVPSSDTEGPLP